MFLNKLKQHRDQVKGKAGLWIRLRKGLSGEETFKQTPDREQGSRHGKWLQAGDQQCQGRRQEGSSPVGLHVPGAEQGCEAEASHTVLAGPLLLLGGERAAAGAAAEERSAACTRGQWRRERGQSHNILLTQMTGLPSGHILTLSLEPSMP